VPFSLKALKDLNSSQDSLYYKLISKYTVTHPLLAAAVCIVALQYRPLIHILCKGNDVLTAGMSIVAALIVWSL